MGKLFKALLVVFMVLATLVITGCGEEKKYNELKNQVMPAIEQITKVDAKGSDEEYNKRLKSVTDPIDKNIAEMKKLAVSETKLNNDCLKVQAKYKDTLERQARGRAEIKAIEKMEKTVTKGISENSLGLK